MDDLHSFHKRQYDKSADLEKLSRWQRFVMLVKLLPRFIFKMILVFTAELYYSLIRPIYRYFVPKLMDIRGQVAVVTGGSNGIGREICLELARCGCNVACLDVDLEAAESLCVELREIGVKAYAYKVDVTNYERLEEIKKQINTDLGLVDILVNNAGLVPKISLRDGSPSDLQRLIDVNVMSQFWTTRVFIDDMISRHRGYIVGMCSMVAYFPASLMVSYATSKYAVRGFMDALNRESRHEHWGVKTLTVFPYFTNTRKELVDYLRSKVDSWNLERVRLVTPARVGRETVRALRRGSGYVSIPRRFLLFGKIHQLLSFQVQNIVDYLFIPRVTSKTNYKEAVKNAFASENLTKKVE